MDWELLDDKTFVMKVKDFVKGFDAPRTSMKEVIEFNETLDIIEGEYDRRFYLDFYESYYELLDIEN